MMAEIWNNVEFDVSNIEESFQKTETNLQKLRQLINNIDFSDRKMKPSKHPSTLANISRVRPKFTNHKIDDEKALDTITMMSDKCPEWFLRVGEIYNALCRAYEEIKKELQQRCEGYRSEKETYTKLKTNMEEVPYKDAEIITDMDKERAVFDKKVEAITSQLAKFKAMKAKQEEKLHRAQETEGKLSEDVCKVKEQISSIVTEISEQEEAIHNIEESTWNILQRINFSKETHSKLKTKWEYEGDIIRELREKWSTLATASEETIDQLRQSLSSSTHEYKKLTTQGLVATNSMNSIKNKQSSLENTKILMKNKLRENETYLKEIMEDLKKIKEKIGSQNETRLCLEDVSHEKTNLAQKDTEHVQSILTTKQQMITNRRKSTYQEQQALSSLEEEIFQWKKTLHQATKREAKLKEQKIVSEKKVQDLDEEHKSILCIIKRYKFDIHQLEAGIQKKENDFKRQRRHFETRDIEMKQELKNFNDSIHSEERFTKELLLNSECEAVTLKNELTSLEKAEKESIAREKMLSLKVHKIESQLHIIENQLTDLQQFCEYCQIFPSRELEISRQVEDELQEEIQELKLEESCLLKCATSIQKNIDDIQQDIDELTTSNLIILASLADLRQEKSQLNKNKYNNLVSVEFMEPVLIKLEENLKKRREKFESYMLGVNEDKCVLSDQLKLYLTVNNNLSLEYERIYSELQEMKLNLPMTFLNKLQLCEAIELRRQEVAVQNVYSEWIFQFVSTPWSVSSDKKSETLLKLEQEFQACLEIKDEILDALASML